MILPAITELLERYELKNVIKRGSFNELNTQWLSERFEHIYAIEGDEEYGQSRLIKNVSAYNTDSRMLHILLLNLKGDLLFLLNNVNLKNTSLELEIINKYKNNIGNIYLLIGNFSAEKFKTIEPKITAIYGEGNYELFYPADEKKDFVIAIPLSRSWRQSLIRQEKGFLYSILIPSIKSRADLLAELKRELYSQIAALGAENVVQVLENVDNKEKTTGEKRNELLDLATGKYIGFIDDDDWVYPYYVREILVATGSNADTFAINGIHTMKGKTTKWFISIKNQVKNQRGVFFRKTNHLSPVKRELAVKARFPHKRNAEDSEYSERVSKLINTEFIIHPPMYHYRESMNKEY